MQLLGVILIATATLVAMASAHSVKYRCAALTPPLHGKILGRTYDYYHVGQVIYFACDHDYELDGYSSTTCDYDKDNYRTMWRYPVPVCKRSRFISFCLLSWSPSPLYFSVQCIHVTCIVRLVEGG